MSSSPLKPLIALYKTYRGGEWFLSSLGSIRRHCVGIVAVMSDQPWRGVAGASHPSENCREPLAVFQSNHPELTVLTIRPTGRQSTEEQYQTGLSLIKSSFGPNCGVLIIDTDEVWEESNISRLHTDMSTDHHSLYFRSGIFTYLRSPLYRVAPQEDARVVVGLANPSLPTGKSRFSNLYNLTQKNRIKDVPCNFHHYGYVRNDSEEIISKLACSISQDGVPPVNDWKRLVWDNLPSGIDIHPQVGFAHCWHHVEELTTMSNCPQSVLESEAFWAGLAYHQPNSEIDNPFIHHNPAWRRRADTLPPTECPISTTKPNSTIPLCAAMNTLMAGRSLQWYQWNYLTPRLRMSFRETVQLATLASKVPSSGTVVEIGSGFGGSMAIMALVCVPNTSLTAIDPYLPYDEENVTTTQGVTEGSAAEFRDTIHSLTPLMQVELVMLPSTTAVTQWEEDSIDLLLVDGNHSYTNCKEDLLLWWPKVKSGGIILVHDYATRFPGVIRAVKEFESEVGLEFNLPALSTLAWLAKP